MFPNAAIISFGVRRHIVNSLATSNFLFGRRSANADFRSENFRFYCDQREPRIGRPLPLHLRLEVPNPAFAVRKPRPLESLTYFDDDAEENETEENDVLYSSVEIETRSHDSAVLKSYETFALSAAKHLDITVSSVYVPREKYIRWFCTLLRSVHIFKKRRFQYETRTHYRRFTIAKITGSTADTFLEYIQRNLPEGVGMRVKRKQLIERPDYLKQPPRGAPAQEAEERKESVGKKISEENIVA